MYILWPIRYDYRKVEGDMRSRRHKCLHDEVIGDVDVSGGVERRRGMLVGNSDEEVSLMLHPTEQCGIEGYSLFADMDDLDHWRALLATTVRASSEYSRLPQCELEATQSVLEILLCLNSCLQ